MIYKCPNKSGCKNEGKVICHKAGQGYTNAMGFLIKCVGNGDVHQIKKVYDDIMLNDGTLFSQKRLMYTLESSNVATDSDYSMKK